MCYGAALSHLTTVSFMRSMRGEGRTAELMIKSFHLIAVRHVIRIKRIHVRRCPRHVVLAHNFDAKLVN